MQLERRHQQSGAALYVALFATIVLAGIGLSLVSEVVEAKEEHHSSRYQMERLYVAEAGVEHALVEITNGGDGSVASAAAPQPFETGEFWVTSTDNGDGTFTVVSRGRVRGKTRALQAVIAPTTQIFDHAVFAGNRSRDPLYDLDFGGFGDQADDINGDVYSGGDVTVWGDANLNGTARATGQVHGVGGQEGVSQPIPDIPAMNYEANHDVDVSAEFAAKEAYRANAAGGSAWEVPADSQAHFLRKNPSDRSDETVTTVKDDYFLEDPYEPVSTDSSQDGSNAYEISLTDGTGGGARLLRRVYFIDGNLWVHNKHTYSFKFSAPDHDGLGVTFVVKGNIYVSDNVFYEDAARDGVAFIAMKDEAVPDSGNIYFGDPRFGTLLTMDGFMYAEENFYDVNLSADGSKVVTLNGTMSAGNHVAIQRTFGTEHSKLTVNFDDRLVGGQLDLPGVPQQDDTLDFHVAVWLEVTPNQ